jgi:uncharacterized SAM-binding protein YcdF (DUF218 family)
MQPTRKLLFAASLVLFLILAAFVFLKEWSRVVYFEPTAWTTPHKGDCAVVLTGGAGRVREGFDLLSQGRVKKLIVAGVNPRSELREIFPEWPFYGSISSDDVILEKRSGTTYGNAQQTLPLVEALGCRSIVLITSTLHMHRAFELFRAVFPSEISIEPRAVVSGSLKPSIFDAGLEVIKSLFYSSWAY